MQKARARLFFENGGCRQSTGSDGIASLSGANIFAAYQSSGIIVRIFVSNPGRFCRLLVDCPRLGQIVWLRITHQFQLSLPQPQLDRVLASLAHLAFDLAAGIPLFSSGRESQGRAPHLCESLSGHVSGRTLARRSLVLRTMGDGAWHWSGDRTVVWAQGEIRQRWLELERHSPSDRGVSRRFVSLVAV